MLSLLILCVLFIKTSKLYDNKELIFLALLASTITQTLSFNSVSNKMVFTERYEDLKTDKNLNKLDIIKLKNNELEHQFLYVQKQCIVQNAYEPLNLFQLMSAFAAVAAALSHSRIGVPSGSTKGSPPAAKHSSALTPGVHSPF